MKIRIFAALVLSTASIASAWPVSANDDLVRGIFGVIAGGMIQGMQNQQNSQPRYREEAPQQQFRVGDENAERIAFRREIQRRLNLLGYDAGYPDGSFGARTRQAIAAFQRSIGRRPTGKITETEVATLYEHTNGLKGPVAVPPNLAANRPQGGTYAAPQPGQQQPVAYQEAPTAYQEPGSSQPAATAYEEPPSTTMMPAPAAVSATAQPTAYQEPPAPHVVATEYQEPLATDVKAQPFIEPSTPQVQATAYVEPAATEVKAIGYIEPPTPKVDAQPAAAAQAKPAPVAVAYQEPAPIQVAAATQPTIAQPGAADASTAELVRHAICTNDGSEQKSVQAFIDAGALEKETAIRMVDTAIRNCAGTNLSTLDFLLSLEGAPYTRPIPLWINVPSYEHGNASDLFFERVWLTTRRNTRVVIEVTYPQLVMLINHFGGSSTYHAQNTVFANSIGSAVAKRDCLGYPPIFYAATMGNNMDYLRLLLANGADPNMLVPFAGDGAGVLGELLDGTNPVSSGNNGGKGYVLQSQFGCVSQGPSAGLMNAYKQHNELVPVWTFALKNVDMAYNKQNFGIVTTMLARVPSVPASTIVDIMRNNRWRIDVNQSEDLAMVKLLVSKGADINAPLPDGTRPMALWIKQGLKKENLQVLLSLGARM